MLQRGAAYKYCKSRAGGKAQNREPVDLSEENADNRREVQRKETFKEKERQCEFDGVNWQRWDSNSSQKEKNVKRGGGGGGGGCGKSKSDMQSLLSPGCEK